MRISESSTFDCHKSLCSVFPLFLIHFGHNLLRWEFKNRYSTKSASVTKKYISDHIYLSIHLYQLMILLRRIWLPEFIHNDHCSPKMRILWHNANLLNLIRPWIWLALTLSYNIQQKGDISPQTDPAQQGKVLGSKKCATRALRLSLGIAIPKYCKTEVRSMCSSKNA